ncbi:MAG: thiamine pyrophosphate-dependent enzyme [Myxococcota bacterium]
MSEIDASYSAETLDQSFVETLRHAKANPGSGAGERLAECVSAQQAIELFEAQLTSRHLDFAALALRERGQGFYTIGSSGHEGNVVVAEALLPSDPALLHYRSGAFFLRRARQMQYAEAARDVLLGVAAAREEPIAGGRHKVFGSADLGIPPQTSTIGSHLPKAVGMAFHLKRAARLGLNETTPSNAVVMCSFGDASANHSTATAAFNAAGYISYQGLDLPLLFVCEDNRIGISVRTAPGWIAQSFQNKPGVKYFAGDGCNLLDGLEAAREAVHYVRSERKPAFLHLDVVRLFGHAGSDVALAYRTVDELRADLVRDPLVSTARLLMDASILTRDEVLDRYETTRREIAGLAEAAAAKEGLRDAADVMGPISPRSPEKVHVEVKRSFEPDARTEFWGKRLPESTGPMPLSQHINRCLGDMLVKYPELAIFGEDVARKGGVYGVTRSLLKRAGGVRVYDTLLDEQTILGLAIGAAQVGCIPIPEIQYLAYLHTAEDQLRGEAATLQFFSQAQFRNPMIVRIAAYAYQAGFGGHFHNDNSIALFRDIPGVIVASPSNGPDAAGMLRTCVAAARVDGSVSVYLEPIALYHTKDLHEEGDGEYLASYDPEGEHIPLGVGKTYGDGEDLTIVSFANGVRMSRRVMRRLEAKGIRARLLDLRWIAPLPEQDLLREALATGKVLVVDETRSSGGVSEGVFSSLIDMGFTGPMARIAAQDTFIPLGPAADHVLVTEGDIEAAALELVGRD